MISQDQATVSDPFRWLEDETSNATREWLRVKQRDAAAKLDDHPARGDLRRGLERFSTAPDASLPRFGGPYEFRWRSYADGRPDTLHVSRRDSQEERLLLDPAQTSGAMEFAVRGIYPSPNGRYLAYRKCAANADGASVVVLDVLSGRTAAVVEGARFGFPSWSPDSRGFFLLRESQPGNGTGAHQGRLELCWIPIPRQADERVLAVFPAGKGVVRAHCSEDGQMLIVEDPTCPPASRLRYLRLGDPPSAFETLAEGACLQDPQWWRGSFWGRVGDRTSGGRIERITLDGNRETVVAERDGRLRHYALIGGQVATTYLADGVSEVRIIDPESGANRALRLPGVGITSGVEGSTRDATAHFVFSSLDSSHAVYRVDLRSGQVRLCPGGQSPLALPNIRTERCTYDSSDRERIPIHVARPQDANGPRPALLAGYGGFGVCMNAEYTPLYAAWLDLGGVVALAGLRGGGERGQLWHEAGCGPGKQQAVEDLIFAARWLEQAGISSPAMTAAIGTSNGALIAASAMLQSPESFAAGVLIAPLADMARYPLHGLGRLWLREYGSPAERATLAQLVSYSPYHLAQRPGNHPPLLVMCNAADDRVDPLHARKLVAALDQRRLAPVYLRSRPFGHTGPFTIAQQLDDDADILLFLREYLVAGGDLRTA